MKILKDGIIIDTYVGECQVCKAIMEAKLLDLTFTKAKDVDDVDRYTHSCMFCESPIVSFFRVDTVGAKKILRHAGINALTFIKKCIKKADVDDVGIYAPGTK